MDNQKMQLITRNSNLELYRIIVMLLIVAHHYVVNSGLGEVLQENPLSGRSIFFYLFGAWGKTGINCFVMITGYFMCKSQITLHKFLKLLFEVLFYNIVIYTIFVIAGYEKISFNSLVNIIPGRILNTNFTSCFLVFYLCIPFLNILIKNLTQKQHLLLIGLCLFIYTFHTTIPRTYVAMNYVSWFCVIYFIASYIRLYPHKYDNNIQFWKRGVFLCIFLSTFSILRQLWMGAHGQPILPYRYVSESNELLPVVLTAICSFMYFKNIQIPQNKWINMIGGSTFGILLIHANSDAMRKWLWHDLLDNANHYQDYLFWIRPPLLICSIFIICCIIDIARLYLLEPYYLRLIKNYLYIPSRKH